MKTNPELLKDVRAARSLVERAQAVHGNGPYEPLLASLSEDERMLEESVRNAHAAFCAASALRPEFYHGMDSVRMVVFPPSDTEQMPHIGMNTWNALKAILHSEDVMVDARYDVAVMESGVVSRIIKGRLV